MPSLHPFLIHCRTVSLRLRRLFPPFGVIVAALLPLCAPAQPVSTGTATGRVYNPRTHEFVRNAEVRIEGSDRVTYTESDGSYRLDNIPAGNVTLAVTYTGYERSTVPLTISAGMTATHDINLVPTEADREVIQLSQFVVSAEREGNAKAIMDQRAALNAKTVIASDNFGHIAEGNVGEFIKYLPGVVMDNTEADARAPRLAGLDPKYAGVTLDGQSLASAQSANFGGDTRQFEMEMFSINSIESIEINKTLTADMDANAPAGTVNLRSKNAFELKGRRINYNLSALASSYAMTLHKTIGPDNRSRLKIRPGFIFDAADSFLDNRMGVQFTLSQSNGFQEQFRQQMTYDFGDPARGPVVTNITWRPGPKLTQRSAVGLNLDFKLTPALIVSLRSAYSILNDEFNNRNFSLIVSRADVDPSSTINHIIARPTANANTRLEAGETLRNKVGETLSLSPRFEYKRGSLVFSGAGAYSRSFVHYEDIANGYFSQAPIRLTRIGWTATRSAGNQTAWDVAQTSGLPWSDPTSFNRADPTTNTIRSTAKDGINQKSSVNLDLRKAFATRLPFVAKVGTKYQVDDHSLNDPGNQQYTYVGPTGVSTAPEAVFPVDTAYVFDPHKGGNIAQQDWHYPDRSGVYTLFRAHPDWFREDTVGNFTRRLQGVKDVKEDITAGYVNLNTRWRQLRLDGGLRYENTETKGKVIDPIPDATIRRDRPDLVSGTIPYVTYKYRNGDRVEKTGRHDGVFLSGSAKYAITRNLDGQLSFSQAIQRPNVDNIAGIASIDETNLRVTVPNPDLKPERSTKYYAGLQYYIEPAGTFSVAGYVLDLKNMLTSRSTITQAEAGYGDDPAYNGYTFSTFLNATAQRQLRGLEVSYSQQFSFLPKPFNGLSAFASYTRVHADSVVERHFPKAATGGIGYRYNRFNIQVKSTWQSPRVFDIVSTTLTRYQKERFMIDVSSDYRISNHARLFVSGRNVFNEPVIYYDNEPGLLRQHDQYGVQWTFGVKGTF
jgi:iron complex outermembrane recepter protein